MTPEDFRNELIKQLVPFKYRQVVTKGIPESWLVLKKGSYALACIPYAEIPADDCGDALLGAQPHVLGLRGQPEL